MEEIIRTTWKVRKDCEAFLHLKRGHTLEGFIVRKWEGMGQL